MALTAKHKELIGRLETRQKELNDFMQERGDNITAADLTKAKEIRADLEKIVGEIEVQKEADSIRTDAAKYSDFLNKPTPSMRHQAVVGSKHDGDTVLGRRKSSREFRILKQHGAGIFGKEKFDAIASREYRDSWCEWFRKGDKAKRVHLRNIEEGLDPQGGYLSPLEIIARLIQKKPTPTRVQGLVSIVNSSRDAVSLPRVNYNVNATDDAQGYIYTTGFRVTNTDENPTSDTQAIVSDTNIFGSVRVPNYTFMIEGILTNNQVEDAMFDPMAWMTEKFVQTVELLRDNKIINGSGNTEPSGILINPGGGSAPTAAGATADTTQFPMVFSSGNASSPFVIPDQIIAISESLPEQYDENCRFVYQRTSTGVTIRQLKDNQGRYLFGMGYQDSGLAAPRAPMLNSYPIAWSQFMPAIGAAPANFLLFGDLEGYTMVNRVGFTVQILREIAARRNQVIILGRVRFGGLLLEPWRIRVMQTHA